MANARIDKVLVVGTGHLCRATHDVLNAGPSACPWPLMSFMSWEYGWMVFVPEREDRKELEELSPDIAQLFPLARRLGCDCVRFDVDADPHPDLEVFDWDESPVISAVRLVRMRAARLEATNAAA